MSSTAAPPESGSVPSLRPPGSALGRYALRHRIAEGGMGAVYLAQLVTDPTFAKWVAVKVVHPSHASDPAFVTMFKDEARLAAMITHPNVAQVFDFGAERDVLYLAMEYLHGETLSSIARTAWREGSSLSPQFAARVVADAARGLHAAHELRLPDGRPAGVVHRDVSPQNIFVLYDGASKIVDFGIAKSNDRLSERTATDVVKGKIAYLAPEQLRPQPIDRRADIFALGIVLWEITLGRRLFKADNEAATVFMIASGEVTPPSKLRSDYPPTLERIVMRALANDRDARYATCAELARDLEKFLIESGEPFGPSEVSEVMHSLFATQISERKRLLSDNGPLPGDGAAKTAQSDSLSFPRGNDAAKLEPSTKSGPTGLERTVVNGAIGDVVARMSTPSDEIALPTRQTSGAALAIVAGLVVLGGIATLGYLHPWRSSAPPSHATAAANVPVAPPPPRPVHVEIRTDPATATLFLDGQAVANPYVIDQPPSSAPHRIEAHAQGFFTTERDVRFDNATALVIPLNRADTAGHDVAPAAPPGHDATPRDTRHSGHAGHGTSAVPNGAPHEGLGAFTNY